jgi:hypothetical protein
MPLVGLREVQVVHSAVPIVEQRGGVRLRDRRPRPGQKHGGDDTYADVAAGHASLLDYVQRAARQSERV